MDEQNSKKAYRDLLEKIIKEGGSAIPHGSDEHSKAYIIGMLQSDKFFEDLLKRNNGLENVINRGRCKILEITDTISKQQILNGDDKLDDFISTLFYLCTTMKTEFLIDMTISGGSLTVIVPYIMWYLGYKSAINDINKTGGIK